VNSDHDTSAGQGWYDSGSTANFAMTDTTVAGTTGTQYVFTGWSSSDTGGYTGSDVSHSVTMNNPITETAIWQTQYWVQYAVTGCVLSVTPPSDEWVNAGGSAIGAFTPQVTDTGTRCNFVSSSPASGPINGPTTITGTYQTQYLLTVNSDHDTPGGGGWYSSGSAASATLTDGTVSGGTGIQYVFKSWSGDASGTGLTSNGITMDGPKTATAIWQTQYYLTVDSAHDSPTGQGWYDAGTSVSSSVTSPADELAGTRYRVTGWTGTGSAPPSGTATTTGSFNINAPSSVTWNWIAQYYLTISVSPPSTGTTVPVAGSYWYDSGTGVTVMATPASGYTFASWLLDGLPAGSSNSITVGMNAPHNLVGQFQVAVQSAIAFNFNGNNIAAGNTIWFNNVLKLKSHAPTTPLAIRFTGQTIKFSAGSTQYTLPIPDCTVIFDPLATSASTTFTGGTWITRVPASFGDNVFLCGFGYKVPAGGLPGGIKSVTWSGAFTGSAAYSIEWQWAAAVYTSFPTDYNSLGVKPLHSTSLDSYHNGDQAGTPESNKNFVTGGATGGGGSNYTGGYSSTMSVSFP